VGCGAGGEGKDLYLGRGVEPQPEEQPERVHLPGGSNARGPAEQPSAEEAALEQPRFELRAVVSAIAHRPEDAEGVDEDQQVEHPDDPQERSRHAHPDEAAVSMAIAPSPPSVG
jgi:hypothetical protein